MSGESVLEQAQAAAAAREYERAIKLYTQAVEAAPTAAALAGRASVHNKLKNYMEAAADASHAIELDDKLVPAHKEKGSACYHLEEYESAMDAFEAAAALEPSKKIHKTWVDMCRVQMGETLPPTPMPPGYGAGAGPLQQEDGPPSSSSASLPAGSAASDAAGGKGITLAGDELQAFLAQARQGGLAQAMGGQRGPPPEAAEEPGSEVPTHATADDPEFSKYWRSPAAASLAAALPDKPAGAKYRHQWFQSAERVEVDVLAKGLKKEAVEVTIEPRRLRVVTSSGEGQKEYELDLALHGEVDPSQSRFEVLGIKVEIRLRKVEAQPWPQLEQGSSAQQQAAAEATAAAEAAATPAAGVADASTPAAAAPQQPSAAGPYAGKKVDWDKVAADIQAEEKEEKLEGEQELMKFFRELYDGGDEDTRRAMVKSMQESGGTALSMNWGEVAQKDFKKQGKDVEEED
ncbi:Protein SGT1 A [Chlorella vulgaris]